jgi:pilus assembly protein CpaE
MTAHQLRVALVTSDPAFRRLVREVLAEPDLGTTLDHEVTVGVGAFADEHVRAIRQINPELLVLDIEDDPAVGVRLAQFLTENVPGLRIAAAGPMLEPELLLGIVRAGAIDYLPKPVGAEALAAAVGRASQLLAAAPRAAAREAGRLYTFFAAKGGAGATTLATNIGVLLARITGRRTLLVDLDLQLGEVALALGVHPRFHLVDLVRNFHRMDAELLASYIEQHESGVHVLSAPFTPEQSEDVSGDEIRRILHFLRQHYDHVVVDTSKSFSPATIAAFDQSDVVYVVTTADLPALRNIQRALPLLRRVLRRGNEQIRLLVNRWHPNDLIPVEEIEHTIGLPVHRKLGNDYEAVIGSLNAGRPIVLNGKSTFAQDVRALASEMAGVDAESDSRWRGLRHLLGRVRGRTEA